MFPMFSKALIVFAVVAGALQAAGTAANELTGKVFTAEKKTISVNDHKVKTGAIVTSGSDIRSDKVGATIDLGTLGRVDIAPKSDLRLGFNQYGVTIHLRSGRLILTTNKGVPGVVTTAEDKVFRTDPAAVSHVEAKTKDADDAEPVDYRN